MIKLPRLLDDNGNEVRRIIPGKVSITENATPLSTASIVLPREQSIPDRSYVELFVPNRSCGIFRSRIPEDVYGGSATITISLEHAICEVGDWIVQQEIKESVMSFPAAISLVFSNYRGTRWQLGRIDATDDVVCNISVSNVLTAMLSLMKQIPTYMMDFDFSTTPWTINIVRLQTVVSAEGRLSRNIVSARVRRDDSQLFTRVYLDGLPPENNEAIGHMDADTVDQYGIIETVLQANDYTEEEAMLVASTYLQTHKRPVNTVQIDGIDFSAVTGEPLDMVALGKLYRLSVQDMDEVIEEHITQLNWRDVYNDPGRVQIRLSEEAETVLRIIHEQGVSQTASSNLQNNRNSEYQSESSANARKTATGSISITVSSFTTPQEFTVNISPQMDTVNYAVLIVPDNESDTDQVMLAGFDYGIYAKTRASFKTLISIPSSSTSGLTTILLRWFAYAK